MPFNSRERPCRIFGQPARLRHDAGEATASLGKTNIIVAFRKHYAQPTQLCV